MSTSVKDPETMSIRELKREIKSHGATARRELRLVLEKSDLVAMLKRLRGQGEKVAAGGGKGEEDPKESLLCKGECGASLRRDHAGLVCANDHNFCGECSPVIVSVSLEAGVYPIPCPACKAPIKGESFERQLDEAQRAIYLSYVTMATVEEGWKMESCPSCSYFELWDIFGCETIFRCRRPDCSRHSCTYCHLEVDKISEEHGGFSDAEFTRQKAQPTSPVYHMDCKELDTHKKPFDDAAADGIVQACPKCGHKGQKNGNCTHIT